MLTYNGKGANMAHKNRPDVIALQNVEDELWNSVNAFLANHKRIPSKSQLAKAALEVYIALANSYGIDHEWKPKLPGVDPTIYVPKKLGQEGGKE